MELGIDGHTHLRAVLHLVQRLCRGAGVVGVSIEGCLVHSSRVERCLADPLPYALSMQSGDGLCGEDRGGVSNDNLLGAALVDADLLSTPVCTPVANSMLVYGGEP